MASARPLNYSTQIAAEKTVGECQALLARSGASSVSVEYKDGEPAGLSFRLDTAHGRREFDLPVNVAGAQKAIAAMLRENPPHVSRSELSKLGSRKHATNVAWRVVRDWLEATLALIAAGMATLDETMLPYLRMDDDRTLYQAYRAREQSLELAAGNG